VRGLENREGRLVFTMHLLPQNLDDEKITGKVTFRKGERDDTHNLSGFSSFFYVTVLAALSYHKFLFTTKMLLPSVHKKVTLSRRKGGRIGRFSPGRVTAIAVVDVNFLGISGHLLPNLDGVI